MTCSYCRYFEIRENFATLFVSYFEEGFSLLEDALKISLGPLESVHRNVWISHVCIGAHLAILMWHGWFPCLWTHLSFSFSPVGGSFFVFDNGSKRHCSASGPGHLAFLFPFPSHRPGGRSPGCFSPIIFMSCGVSSFSLLHGCIPCICMWWIFLPSAPCLPSHQPGCLFHFHFPLPSDLCWWQGTSGGNPSRHK